MPRIKSEKNLNTRNKLLWILSGKVYQAPINSFLNFHLDSKINKNSYIFRSKIVNQQSGLIVSVPNSSKVFQQNIEITNEILFLKNSNIQKILFSKSSKEFLLSIDNLKFIIKTELSGLIFQIQKLKNKIFGKLISKSFTTLTGGYVFYSQKMKRKPPICFLYNNEKIYSPTLIWLSEENYNVSCDINFLTSENNSFIFAKTEILPNLFSKTSGILCIKEKNNMIQEVSIKSGFLYKVDDLNIIKNLDNKIFFPGEKILENIELNQISLCQVQKNTNFNQLLIRPINIYEVSFSKDCQAKIERNFKSNKLINLIYDIAYPYNSGEKIKTSGQVEILNQFLEFQLKNSLKKENLIQIKILNNKNKNSLNFLFSKQFSSNFFIPVDLKQSEIKSCFLIKKNQFIDKYSTLGFLETSTLKSLEIVKLKSKRKRNRQLFLISNDDCIKFQKKQVKNKNIKDFLFDTTNLNKLGKILINNSNLVTIQKGRPYFFPNCQDNDLINNNDLKYKLIDSNLSHLNLFNRKNININYCNITKIPSGLLPLTNLYERLDFPKTLIKKRGKYYSSGIPILVREFLINKKANKLSKLSKLEKIPWHGYLDYKEKTYKIKRRDLLNYLDRVRIENVFLMFIRSSEVVVNKIKKNDICSSEAELATLGLLEHPFKNLGIHSITEDYFEKDVNNVFCKNGEFIESGQTIGLLNFEKEITGDIVQGLPRIEELLEARKKKRMSKYTPKNFKKSLLVRQTAIDPSFEFRKLGTTIKENEKINPHNLLKIYFKYFAKIRYFIKDGSRKIKLCRLTDNYEASYKSFKKVQFLILNSVQSVYQSQGVTIANKHLEVIIKQMTTKVLITHEGNTPLLPREVVDLYHINYINQIVNNQQKSTACYVPLLLGITKAALNNPSFISAASFQETTKVLTKAAIEGRLDWLRGLKENIIIGHLIPSGTGYKSYFNSFKKKLNTYLPLTSMITGLKIF